MMQMTGMKSRSGSVMQRTRHGMTGPDTMMVVVIIGILVALLLPAVQAAREAARRTQCSNHMKRITLSMHNYHDAYNALPAGVGAIGQSVHVPLLPFVEQAAVYEMILSSKPDSVAAIGEIMERQGLQMPMMWCPSDPLGGTTRMAATRTATSYHACAGDAVEVAAKENGDWKPRNAFAAAPDGKPFWGDFYKMRDGTSNTMAFGESKIAFGSESQQPVYDRAGIFTSWNATADKAIPQNCADASGARRYDWLGTRWYDGRMTNTRYLGVLPPNSSNCVQGDETTLSLVTASSYHTGGTNLAIFDGSIRFVSNTISAGDPTNNAVNRTAGPSPYGVWGALATMDGGETGGMY